MRFANREYLIRCWGHGAHPLRWIKISTRLAGLLIGVIPLRGTVQVKTVGSREPHRRGMDHPHSGAMRLVLPLPIFWVKNIPLATMHPKPNAVVRNSSSKAAASGGTMVGLEGVEPPTNGLGNRCSIHLSYRPHSIRLLRFYYTRLRLETAALTSIWPYLAS